MLCSTLQSIPVVPHDAPLLSVTLVLSRWYWRVGTVSHWDSRVGTLALWLWWLRVPTFDSSSVNCITLSRWYTHVRRHETEPLVQIMCTTNPDHAVWDDSITLVLTWCYCIRESPSFRHRAIGRGHRGIGRGHRGIGRGGLKMSMDGCWFLVAIHDSLKTMIDLGGLTTIY